MNGALRYPRFLYEVHENPSKRRSIRRLPYRNIADSTDPPPKEITLDYKLIIVLLKSKALR